MSEKPFAILLVDDNPADVRLFEEAVCRWNSPCEVYKVNDGEKALDFLCQRNGYESAPRPTLVFLDLRIPKLDGVEVLHFIKVSPGLRTIPVIVFAADTSQETMIEVYNQGANAFIPKPVGLDDFFSTLDITGQYWLSVVSLPGGNGSPKQRATASA